VKLECPMCGEYMRLRQTEQIHRIAGTLQDSRRLVFEWTCPECDYFEEADEGISGIDENGGART
jgi:predicted RNA-binding Zn-ribbon protein involved in translation (DUF1610 family)